MHCAARKVEICLPDSGSVTWLTREADVHSSLHCAIILMEKLVYIVSFWSRSLLNDDN